MTKCTMLLQKKMTSSDNLKVVIITGLSGSGKSTVLRALEDIGYFCIDNLPVVLLPRFLKIRQAEVSEVTKIALVMDLRQPHFLEKYPRIFGRLKEQGYDLEILFLEATDEVLINRFSETRRVHPLSREGSLLEGILIERGKLTSLKEMATKVIDTTSLNVHQLKDLIQRHFLSLEGREKLLFVHVTSFGYRFGLPTDADLIFDVRFLPNPFYINEFKDLNGHHEEVRRFVLSEGKGKTFMEKLLELMTFLLPLYEKEGKVRLNIAFGCTAGKHRSVVVANEFHTYLSKKNYQVTINHRDINKS